jgi:hypothetical protein
MGFFGFKEKKMFKNNKNKNYADCEGSGKVFIEINES